VYGALSCWRNSSVQENLLKFEKMRTGQYEEGTAFLRMKVLVYEALSY
jgi:hypothetical protein